MEVKLGQNLFVNNVPVQKKQKFSVPNNASLKQDIVSFKSSQSVLKKSDFNGFDLAVIERFRIDISQFKDKEDLQNIAKEKIEKIKKTDFGGRQEETKIQRKAMLKEWFDYVTKENNAYTNVQRFIILNAITKDLKLNNDELPPVLNKGVLAGCMEELENRFKDNGKELNFDFNKLYQNKMRVFYMEDTDTGEVETKWVKIPSKKHDPANFKANVEKLKVLSHKSWCTKSYNAEPYLRDGDFHVYLEKGRPKIGIRLVNSKIKEIQGEKNDSNIPLKYFDEINYYIDKNSLKVDKYTKLKIREASKTKDLVEKSINDLKDAIKTNDVQKILEYFKIKTQKDENGFLTISEYKQPRENIQFSDLGINENDLFKKIKHVTGNVNLLDSDLVSTGVLESVGQNFFLTHYKGSELKTPNLKTIKGCIVGNEEAKIKLIGKLDFYGNDDIKTFKEKLSGLAKTTNYNAEEIFEAMGIDVEKDKDGFLILSEYKLPLANHMKFEDFGINEEKLFEKVKRIKGNGKFVGSSLKTLKNLESIGGNFEVSDEIESLGNLKEVGKNFVCYRSRKLKTLGQLKRIGGYLNINNSSLESLGDLEYIGDSIYVQNAQKLQSLGKLKTVNKTVYLENSNITDLGNLEYVGENLLLSETNIKDVSKLKFVGEFIQYQNSLLKYSDFSHIKRNHSPLFYIWYKICSLPIG